MWDCFLLLTTKHFHLFHSFADAHDSFAILDRYSRRNIKANACSVVDGICKGKFECFYRRLWLTIQKLTCDWRIENIAVLLQRIMRSIPFGLKVVIVQKLAFWLPFNFQEENAKCNKRKQHILVWKLLLLKCDWGKQNGEKTNFKTKKEGSIFGRCCCYFFAFSHDLNNAILISETTN